VTGLSQLQSRFMQYLRYADDAIVADIDASSGHERERRLSIYYNAYRIRLIGSIETDHPVLGVYLGDYRFEQMARSYIAAHPSTQTSLRHFCDQLPGFLGKQEPFKEISILSQLAMFERLLLEVFDAADATVDNIDTLSTLTAEQWPDLTLRIHPSVRLHVTQWNDVEIWRAIKAEQDPPVASQGDNRAWLLWRNREQLTEFRSLAMDEYTMLCGALNGANFSTLCEAQLEWHKDTAVAERAFSLLRSWFEAGIIASDSSLASSTS